jgi:hypothetical protein
VTNVPALTGDQVVHNTLNIAYSLGGTIAVIVIIVGGVMYATSGGESAGITKAKNMITYAVVGLAVIIAAFAITNFVISRFK